MSDFLSKMIMGDFKREPRNPKFPYFHVIEDDFENKKTFTFWGGISDVVPRDLRSSWMDGMIVHNSVSGSTYSLRIRATEINNDLNILLDYHYSGEDWNFIHNGSIIILTDDKTNIKLIPEQLDSGTDNGVMEFGTCVLKKEDIFKIASSKSVRVRVTGASGLFVELTNSSTTIGEFKLDETISDDFITSMKKTYFTFFDQNAFVSELSNEINKIKDFKNNNPKKNTPVKESFFQIYGPKNTKDWLWILLFCPIGVLRLIKRSKK